jgi:imidazolonepropionase-like amidohydrolase
VAVLSPFIILGCYQAYSRDHLRKAQILQRDLERSETLLIQGPRIFVGNGQIIEIGAVLVKDGIIEEVFGMRVPDPYSYKAIVIEGSGKTLLPGLIDVHVHLAVSAGFTDSSQEIDLQKGMSRALASYLYSGVTTVKSATDPLEESLKLQGKVSAGERLGSSFFTCGPAFTTEGDMAPNF